MIVSIPSSYFTPPQTVGEVNHDDGINTVILFHSPQGQGGIQLGIYLELLCNPVTFEKNCGTNVSNHNFPFISDHVGLIFS